MDRMNFAEMHQVVWKGLSNALVSHQHPFRQMILGTLSQGLPDLRMVVMRGAEEATGMIYFHTDRRSPKAIAIRQQPAVSILWYDAVQKIQLRTAARAEVLESGPLVEQRWAATGISSRRCYMAHWGSSQPVGHPSIGFDSLYAEQLPDLEATEIGRQHFAVVSCSIQSIDFLQLFYNGHHRARLLYQQGVLQGGEWLVP